MTTLTGVSEKCSSKTMAHIDDMIFRLPQLYREGELVRELLALPGLQIEILDELGREVQREHWFDSAVELKNAAALAAVLDIPPEDWQGLQEYRAWVHALRNAWLRDGAATLAGLQAFVAEYVRLYQEAVEIQTIRTPLTLWSETFKRTEASFVENPPQRRFLRVPAIGGIEPLQQFSLTQKGLDDAYADFLLVGLATAPEYVPAMINTSTGQALIFLGKIAPGERLWIRATEAGGIFAKLEDRDVSAQFRSVSAVTPGTAWANTQVEQPAKALVLQRGKNDLWFLPIAHFDQQGLDRFLMALADLLLKQGRFDETGFEAALFFQEPAVLFSLAWTEIQPASFDLNLPAGAMVSPREQLEEALVERERLSFSLNLGVQKLKAAGVKGRVELMPFHEMQSQRDFIKEVLPKTIRQIGPTGADRRPDAGGLFEITTFNDSTFR